MGKRDCPAGQPSLSEAWQRMQTLLPMQFLIFTNIVISCVMIYHGVKKVIS